MELWVNQKRTEGRLKSLISAVATQRTWSRAMFNTAAPLSENHYSQNPIYRRFRHEVVNLWV